MRGLIMTFIFCLTISYAFANNPSWQEKRTTRQTANYSDAARIQRVLNAVEKICAIATENERLSDQNLPVFSEKIRARKVQRVLSGFKKFADQKMLMQCFLSIRGNQFTGIEDYVEVIEDAYRYCAYLLSINPSSDALLFLQELSQQADGEGALFLREMIKNHANATKTKKI